jgi:hypothetical protein
VRVGVRVRVRVGVRVRVRDARVALVVDEDVGWLDVPVDDVGAVHVAQAADQLCAPAQGQG